MPLPAPRYTNPNPNNPNPPCGICEDLGPYRTGAEHSEHFLSEEEDSGYIADNVDESVRRTLLREIKELENQRWYLTLGEFFCKLFRDEKILRR